MTTVFFPFPSFPSAATYHHLFPSRFTTTYAPGPDFPDQPPPAANQIHGVYYPLPASTYTAVAGLFPAAAYGPTTVPPATALPYAATNSYLPSASAYTTASDFYPPPPPAATPSAPNQEQPQPHPALHTSSSKIQPGLAQLLKRSDGNASLNDDDHSKVDAFHTAAFRRQPDGAPVAVTDLALLLELHDRETDASSPIAAATTTTPSALIFPKCSNTVTNCVQQAAKAAMGSQSYVPVPAEEAVCGHLVREISHIQDRLQHQQYSLQSIQGEVANLQNRVAEISISLGMQHLQDGTIHSQASGFALEPDVQFGEMPICDVNDEETHSYLSKNEIPSPMSASTVDQMKFQIFDRMPIFDVYDDETDGSSTEFGVFVGITEQQKYEDQQDSEKLATLFHKTSENAFGEQLLRDFSKAPETEQTGDDMLDYTFELQQQNDEKASAMVQQLRDPQLTVLVIHERRREWDPGALLPLMSSKAQLVRQALQPAPFSQVFHFGVPTHIPQQSQEQVHMMISLAPNLSTVTHTSVAGVIRCADSISPHSFLSMIVQADHSTAEIMLQHLSASGNCVGNLVMLSVSVPWDPGVFIELSTKELRSGFAEQQSEHITEHFVSEEVNDIKSIMANVNVNVAPSTKFFSLWLMVTWCCAYSCSRVKLCISLPWDPGVPNQLITEEILFELKQQEHGEIQITASSCDSSAGRMCTWAAYCDCLHKCHRAQYQYTVYDSHGNHLPTQFAVNGSSNIELGVQKYCNAKKLLSSHSYLHRWEMDIVFITFLPP